MKRLGLSPKKLKAIFITHEHGDHTHGVSALSKKYQLPVYVTKPTLRNAKMELSEDLIIPFNAYDPIRIGNINITAFPKLHDACDPHSFIVASENVKVGIFTDIGHACDHVIKNFKECHAAFLESNYDEQMLEAGRYPYSLKNRIRGGKGHLSNTQAAELFCEHRPSFMSHLFLSHLSRDNNRPKIVQNLFNSISGGTKIIIASRNKETFLYHITSTIPTRYRYSSSSSLSHTQLPLFNRDDRTLS